MKLNVETFFKKRRSGGKLIRDLRVTSDILDLAPDVERVFAKLCLQQRPFQP